MSLVNQSKLSFLFKPIYLLASLLSVSPLYAGLPDTIEKIKPGIVGVGTVLPTRRPPNKLQGTGFVVGNGLYIITNAHVVDNDLDKENREHFAVFTGRGDDAGAHSVEVIAVDQAHDLALLKLKDKEKLFALTLGREKNVREGQVYAFTGFPIGAVLGLYPATHRGIVSTISPVATPVVSPKDLDVRMIKRLRNPFNVFQLDATAYPGNSGSPLYDPETGEVIGVINKVFVKETKEAVLEKPSGITYAIPVTHVRVLLEKNGVAY